MEGPAFAVVRDECHGIILGVHLGLGLRQDLNRVIPHQASVELVLGVEVCPAAHDRMVRLSKFDVEGPIGIMITHTPSRPGPYAAGDVRELRPLADPDRKSTRLNSSHSN